MGQVCDLRVIKYLQEPLHLRVRKTPRDRTGIESTERVALDVVVDMNDEDNDVDNAGDLERDDGSIDKEDAGPREYSRRVHGVDANEQDGLSKHRYGE